MKTALLVVTASLVCVALYATAETVWTVINQPSTAVMRFNRANERFGKTRIYLIAALIGYLGIVYCGIYGLLFWMPSSWGTVDEYGEFNALRHTVAGLFTFASLPAAWLFERYAQLLNDISMYRQTLKRVEHMIYSVQNLSPVIRSFNLTSEAAPEDLHEADFGWLRKLADTLQRNVSNMIDDALLYERATVEAKTKADDKAAKAQAQRVRNQARGARIEAALEASVPYPAPPVVDKLPDSVTAGWVTIKTSAINARWRNLERIFAVLAVQDGSERDKLRLTDLSVALRTAPGIELPAELKVVGQYRGSAHGGETEIVSTLDGKQVDLAHTAHFAMSLDGLCTAFFIAHLLPTYGRFWHSLANHDYSILFDRSALLAWLLRSGIDTDTDTENSLRALDRPPGLRAWTDGSVLRASALGAGATTNLTDFSIELVDGKMIAFKRQQLIRSKKLILY